MKPSLNPMEVRRAGSQCDSVPTVFVSVNTPLLCYHRARHRAGIAHRNAGVIRLAWVPSPGQSVLQLSPPCIQQVGADAQGAQPRDIATLHS
eukprot:6372443-Alexandrium_andersonii.AAC.1